MMNIPWKQEYKIEQGRYKLFRVGKLCIIIAKLGTEWHIANKYNAHPAIAPEGNYDELPKHFTWKRWESTADDLTCKIMPALPKYPVLSHPSSPITLPPGARAKFFIGVPASVEVWGKCFGQWMLMDTVETDVLSFTWRGQTEHLGTTMSTTKGSVCVSLQTNARRNYDPPIFNPHSIICAIEISNHKEVAIPFYQILLDTAHLSIYLGQYHAWAGFCRFDIYDEQIGDGVLYASGPPREAGFCEFLSNPHLELQKKNKVNVLDIIFKQVKLSV